MRFAQIAAGAVIVALIVTVGFGAVGLVLLALGALYVVVALAMPVFVRAKMRIGETPVVRAIALEDLAIPAEARARLMADREFSSPSALAGARVQLPDDATMRSVYHSQLEASCAIQRRIGLLLPTAVPGVWRPTWRLAFLIAGGAISPGTEFVRRRTR